MTQQQQTQTDAPENAESELPGGIAPPGSDEALTAVSDLIGGKTDEKPGDSEKDKPKSDSVELTMAEALAGVEKPSDSRESDETVKPPKTLMELAEKAGIKVEDLYAITIPSADEKGESPTIGGLKDLAATQIDFAGRELLLEERRVEFGNDQAEARAELETVLAALPEGAIKPEVLANARKQRAAVLDREAARLLDVIPEWKDDKVKREGMGLIAEHLAHYGFSARHAELISDHRMLRYMRDNQRRLLLVENALQKVKPIKAAPKGKPKTPPAAKPETKIAPVLSQTEQLAAIDKLLATG